MMIGSHVSCCASEDLPDLQPGALRRLYRGLIASREASASRRARQHLAHYSDDVLLSAGYTREEIGRIRGEAS